MTQKERRLAEGFDAASFLRTLLAETADDAIVTDMDYRVLAASCHLTTLKPGDRVEPADSPGASQIVRPVENAAGERIGYLIFPGRSNASLDPLTGVADRRKLESEFARLSARRDKSKAPLSLIFVDLDDFKPVNDSFGHLVGDQILTQFACLLRNHFRTDDLVARYGGDEFVVLCSNCPQESADRRIRLFLEKLSGLYVEAHYPESDRKPERIPLGFSYGVIETISGDTFDRAVQKADAALYKMKSARAVIPA